MEVEVIATIFEYDDYVLFLQDAIERRKSKGLPFSYRWFSQKAGFVSPNYLQLVLQRKRHLSEAAVWKVAEIFQLKGSEKDYFSSLVKFNKSKLPSERALFGENLLKIRSRHQIEHLDKTRMSYYLSWQNIAVRECLLLHPQGMKSQQVALHVRPMLQTKEVELILQQLEAIGMVKKSNDESWLAVSQNISSGDRVSSSALISYHLQMIELAKSSLDRFSGNQRDVSNVSVPISKENFEKIRKKIQDIRAEILRMSEEDKDCELVAQINFQLFPIAMKDGV